MGNTFSSQPNNVSFDNEGINDLDLVFVGQNTHSK